MTTSLALKRINYYLVALIAAITMTTSCQKDNLTIAVEGKKSHKIVISAQKEDVKSPTNTRTAITGLVFTWATGDSISLYTTKSNAKAAFKISGGQGTKKGTFGGDLTADNETVYAVYPHDDASTFTTRTYTSHFGMTQMQKHLASGALDATSIGDYAFMYGRSKENVTTGFESTTAVNISMKHLSAIIDFKLTKIPKNTIIRELKLRAESRIFPSKMIVDLSTGNSILSEEKDNITVSLFDSNGGLGVNVGDSTSLTIRLAMLPTTVPVNGTLTVSLTTGDSDHTIIKSATKTQTLGKEYKAGEAYSAALNYATELTTTQEEGRTRIDDFRTIPSLNNISQNEGFLTLKGKINIYYSGLTETPILQNTLSDAIFPSFTVASVATEQDAEVVLKTKAEVITEGYEINITSEKLYIYASSDAGFLYALQSLRQIMGNTKSDNLEISCVEIEDAPRVKFRSFMLDSGRQYQKMATIKKYIDMILMLKMNRFHWHLTETEGWRAQILKYPNLTTIGSEVAKKEGQQGFYTQADMREIVSYAAERSIEVIPEIDMPGHALAAVHSYPEFGCEGLINPTYNANNKHYLFCAGKDATIDLLKDILDEICEIFPSQYIHIGGDEAQKDNWNKCADCKARIEALSLKSSHNLQLWLTSEMANHLATKGRKAIGWGDGLSGNGYPLPSNVVAQWWQSSKANKPKTTGYMNAKNKGLEVICGTNHNNYLNFPTTAWSIYKNDRTFDIQDIYLKNPAYYVPKTSAYDKILGMNTALWTDGNVLENMIDRRVFPRIFAIVEQMWYQNDLKGFDLFMETVRSKQTWFEDLGYMYGPALTSETPADYKWDDRD